MLLQSRLVFRRFLDGFNFMVHVQNTFFKTQFSEYIPGSCCGGLVTGHRSRPLFLPPTSMDFLPNFSNLDCNHGPEIKNISN